jgi:LmbE family N-acetylglucosaminyl deacetylase
VSERPTFGHSGWYCVNHHIDGKAGTLVAISRDQLIGVRSDQKKLIDWQTGEVRSDLVSERASVRAPKLSLRGRVGDLGRKDIGGPRGVLGPFGPRSHLLHRNPDNEGFRHHPAPHWCTHLRIRLGRGPTDCSRCVIFVFFICEVFVTCLHSHSIFRGFRYAKLGRSEHVASDEGAAPISPLIVPRRQVLAGAGLVAGAIALGDVWTKSSFAATKPEGMERELLSADLSNPTNAMYIVAHPDDSLIFQSPSLLQNIQNGLNVFTVHLTAGDDGLGESYWGDRELGIEAAYAFMAGVGNNWTTSALTVGSHQIVLDTLTAMPNVTVAFMRLPDGGYPDGDGTALYNYQSLMQLWQRSESSITAVDESTSYVFQDLINTLASMMSSFQPQLIVVQDYVNTFGDGDHMDHYAAAQFAQSAHDLYSTTHSFVGYMGYQITALAANVSGTLLSTKQSTFYSYGSFDSMTCSSEASCASTTYGPWLLREYIVGSVPTIDMPIASAGPGQVVGLGSVVELDGSTSSDPNDQSLTYSWTQTGGSTVTLSSPSAAQPTFTAPASSQTLTFSLLVANSTEVSAASSVTISVGTPSNVALVAGSSSSTKVETTGALTVTSAKNVASSANVLLAMMQVFGPNSTGVGTISDTKTGTWTALGQTTVTGDTQFILWQCTNPQAGVEHAITWTPSAADSWGALVVMAEWAGGPFTLDKMSSVLTSKGATGATPSVTPSSAGELIIASAADENGTSAWTSPTNSFTSLTTPDSANVMAYLVDSTTSPISTTWSVSPSDSGVTAIFTLH